MSLLEARGVGRAYGGRWVLRGVDLTVAPGERLALLGPSGCGKTTLLNLLGGLDRPDEGRVALAGEDLGAAAPARLAQLRRERLGTVFQFFHLIPTLTARENVELPLQLLGWGREALEARAGDLLEAVGLAPRAEAFPRELSGGEMQRVAVARALAGRPGILLADEPTGNLDSTAGERVLALLAELTEREGAALVMVTHSEAAAAACHRIVRMKDGRILEAGR
ncbi:ABC transporter ATP-binding protein [Mesoterricola sediminis]|uniref:ABC transporter ATP-binding protein n=1 Tax=Mesoterricola sediminis TaxID=2927980 RepID=A0AA48GXZ9_9BACT|nr:ABC transporter ATP-binding protein [Mesoterricola sediminis]BDU76097.1 ABC transporter ATP-binding protein [Mesoterricola sediminis]